MLDKTSKYYAILSTHVRIAITCSTRMYTHGSMTKSRSDTHSYSMHINHCNRITRVYLLAKMIFLVLPKARDAVGLYVKYTMLMSDENVTWRVVIKGVICDSEK